MTNYNNQSNRCRNCGHRLAMAAGHNCTVINGLRADNQVEIPCKCRVHYKRETVQFSFN